MFRSTNVPFDECSVRRMFRSTNVPFDQCSFDESAFDESVFDESAVSPINTLDFLCGNLNDIQTALKPKSRKIL